MNQASKCKHVVLGILGLTLMANTVKGDWVAGTQRCTTHTFLHTPGVFDRRVENGNKASLAGSLGAIVHK